MTDKILKDEASVAYDLMNDILTAEIAKNGGGYPKQYEDNPRKYLLELYAQCADAVKNLNVPDSYDSEK